MKVMGRPSTAHQVVKTTAEVIQLTRRELRRIVRDVRKDGDLDMGIACMVAIVGDADATLADLQRLAEGQQLAETRPELP